MPIIRGHDLDPGQSTRHRHLFKMLPGTLVLRAPSSGSSEERLPFDTDWASMRQAQHEFGDRSKHNTQNERGGSCCPLLPEQKTETRTIEIPRKKQKITSSAQTSPRSHFQDTFGRGWFSGVFSQEGDLSENPQDKRNEGRLPRLRRRGSGVMRRNRSFSTTSEGRCLAWSRKERILSTRLHKGH